MPKHVLPIRPSEAAKKKRSDIPDVVLETFNEFIISDLSKNGRAVIRQDDIVKALVEKGLREGEIYDKHWLDVEGLYRSAGWEVEYDKPAHCENYPATFTFSKNKD